MTEVYNDYRRKTGAREDPRLARRDSKTSTNDRPKQQYDKLGVPISPKQRSPSKSPTRDPRVQDHSWQTHQTQPQTQNAQYNSSMQTAYQHLPPSMYTDHNQYSTQGYSTPYATYQQNYVAQSGGYNPYQGYSQTQTTYNSGTVQPGPPGEDYPQNEWAPVTPYPNMTQAPPPSHPPPVTQQISVEKNDDHKKEAVAQELKQQKAQMAKQREEYVRKATVLRRELELLRNQKQELLTEHSPEHDNNHILRENNKLQIEIQNKMKTIHNVIEMLTNIIGDHLTISELEQAREESPKHRKEKTRRSMSTEKNDLDAKFCYIYYDPELHWCRICDVFPKSAKDYLLHLHSKEHRQITQERDMVDTPWHRLPAEPELPSYEGGTKKRMPIKGLQFLISATSWYCKLCDTWVGDLHCASQHLKSQNHNQNYANFVEQNPHWEIEWLRDRDKALIRTSKEKRSDTDDSDNADILGKKTKKRKDGHSPMDSSKKDKRKKKHTKKRRRHSSDSSSSSSSSDSSSEDDNNDTNDKSKSIRVAMRNKMKLQAQMIMNEDLGGKWEVLGRLVEEHKRKEAAEMGKESGSEDNLINQWMTVHEPQEKDKRLFDNLKDRMKQKQEAEKTRLAELDQKRKEKEKQDQDLRERKEREEREAREREEEKRRQQEEIEKQREKEREQIRFKTKDKYRKRSSASPSPERNRGRYSRSPSTEHRRQDRGSERFRRDNRYNENGRPSSDRRHSPSYEGRDSPGNKRKSYKHDEKETDSRDSDFVKKEKKQSMSSHKKPHFIGRMPLFKNKKNEDKIEKEIKKEDYDIPRQSRFQPGNLARAFIPEPEVVCFPKLSSIPPLIIPPPPTVIVPPEPPKISASPKVLKAPPPPIINSQDKKSVVIEEQDMDIEDQNIPPPPPPPVVMKEPLNKEPQQKLLPRDFQDALNLIYPDPNQMGMDPATMMQYQYNMDYNSMMYQQMYDYSQDVPAESNVPAPEEEVPVEHTLPLPPPPLPPDDPNEDLAMLGISADDMAAQMF